MNKKWTKRGGRRVGLSGGGACMETSLVSITLQLDAVQLAYSTNKFALCDNFKMELPPPEIFDVLQNLTPEEQDIFNEVTQDVLDDITGLADTDSDDYEEIANQRFPVDNTVLRIRRKLCRSRAIPSPSHPLWLFYLDDEVKERNVRKVRLMKEKLMYINLRRIYRGRRFNQELQRLNREYGKSTEAGRGNLNALVAVFLVANWNPHHT